jgi:hypothetical protein
MPGPLERDVLLALYEIAYENYTSKGVPVPERMPLGTMRSFLTRLGLAPGGKTVLSIKIALKRLVYTQCKSENSFFDKSKNLYLTEAFNLLRGIGIVGDSDGQGGTIEETFICFDSHIRDNLNARYLMVLDTHFMRLLRSDIVKQLYPLLSYWFWRMANEDYWRVQYSWLAEHIGIKVWDNLWRAKQQLQAANDELKEKGYLAYYLWDGWDILYFPGEVYKAEQLRRSFAKANAVVDVPAKIGTLTQLEQPDPLIPILNLFAQGVPLAEQLLKQRGISQEQALALCIEKGITGTGKRA